MAWIKSHPQLCQHYKLHKLCAITGWRRNEAIGVLHQLWGWTLTYSETGFLGNFQPEILSQTLDCLKTDWYSHKDFFVKLQEAGFLTQSLFIWDWFDYAGKYLEGKYRTSNPVRYQEIRKICESEMEKAKSDFSQTKDRLKTKKVANKSDIDLDKDKEKEIKRFLREKSPDLLILALKETPLKTQEALAGHITNDKFVSAYVNWTHHKQEKKHPITPRSFVQQLNKLGEQDVEDAIAMLNLAVERGWIGLYPPEKKGPTSTGQVDMIKAWRGNGK